MEVSEMAEVSVPPRISVIIPCYNAAAELSNCLGGLESARFPFAEYIVVDNASSENLAEVVQRSDRPAQLTRMPVRSGSAAARNAGALLANGDILLFLDADVCVHAHTLASALDHFTTHPGVSAVGSYDDCPSALDFHSQFRKLLHCYIHRNNRADAQRSGPDAALCTAMYSTVSAVLTTP
jgi:GT2 family glycosyltransferase